MFDRCTFVTVVANGCIYLPYRSYSLSSGSPPSTVYTHPPLLAGNQSLGYQYVVSLYWAVSTTANVGYGDIFAHTDLEVGILSMYV